MTYSRKIKVGVVGVGHLGKFHVQQYHNINNVICMGVFDINSKEAHRVSEEYNIKAYGVFEDLVNECDAVSICTPTSTHYVVAKQALLSDCHILIEKPITDNIIKAEDLIKISNEYDKIIQVGHIERFNPALSELNLDNIKPTFIESHRLSPFNIRATDVDVVLDLMIHDIDILLNLVKSDINNIVASGVSALSNKIDMANARIEFINGCVANLTASRISQKQLRKFRIFENNKYTNIDFLHHSQETYILDKHKPNKQSPRVIVSENQDKYIIYSKSKIKPYNALTLELNNFIDSILNQNKPLVSGYDGLAAIEVAFKILKQINLNNNK
ncbi:MAG: oxidoreductase [Candidatus Marinimicrobia bacterium]|nr:oxidoreductase [Candidatus Neomarinimicrobiota bacterium]